MNASIFICSKEWKTFATYRSFIQQFQNRKKNVWLRPLCVYNTSIIHFTVVHFYVIFFSHIFVRLDWIWWYQIFLIIKYSQVVVSVQCTIDVSSNRIKRVLIELQFVKSKKKNLITYYTFCFVNSSRTHLFVNNASISQYYKIHNSLRQTWCNLIISQCCKILNVQNCTWIYIFR